MSYLIPTEEISLAEQYRMRKLAIDKGVARAVELWQMAAGNITYRDANYVTDFIPAATAAGLAGWLSMPFLAVAGVYSVFADNVPAAVTPTCPTNQVWVFYKVSILTVAGPDPVAMLQFRKGAAANLLAQFDMEALYGKMVSDGYFSQPVTYENPDIATVNAIARVVLGAGNGCRIRLGTFIVEPLQNTVI
jgi:hypothetical protein